MFDITDVTYKDIVTIDSAHIKKNHITCIYGESGSGKSTLLSLLNRMKSYDTGSIRYNGRPLTQIDPIQLRRDVVMLPQSPPIFKGNVHFNIQIGRFFSNLKPVSEEEAKKALSLVYLETDMDTDAEYLSGGEKQRLAIARLLLMEPSVFLLDEPTSALNPVLEEQILHNLKDYIARNNQSIILISHSKQVVEGFSQTRIQLEKGRIVNVEETHDD